MMKNYLILDSKGEDKLSYGFDYIDGSLVVASFDPWTAKWLKSGYNSDYLGILYSEFNGEETGNESNISHRVFQRYREWRENHIGISICESLDDLVNGDDKGKTRLSYISNIRAYVFFRKNEKGVFDAMDYCPFCGAKLPERLDEKLTEILQKEYGLNSWKDYKKAPHEFHTDEWWKKRGL